MKLHGYCEQCHKIRPISVTGSLMRLGRGGATPVGVCDLCVEEKERAGATRKVRAQDIKVGDTLLFQRGWCRVSGWFVEGGGAIRIEYAGRWHRHMPNERLEVRAR